MDTETDFASGVLKFSRTDYGVWGMTDCGLTGVFCFPSFLQLTHMGVNPLEAEELVRDEDGSDFEFIVYDSWKISGKTAENTFNKTHTFHFL